MTRIDEPPQQPPAPQQSPQPVPYADPSTPRPEHPPLEPYTQKTLRWAWLLWLTPIPPLISIGYGVIALHRTRPQRDRSYRFAWAGVVISTLALLGWVWVAVQVVHIHDSFGRIRCHENVRSLGQALHIYASEHHGEFPDSWSDLAADGILGQNGASLICPARFVHDGGPSYVYCGRGLTLKTTSWTDIIAYEPPGTHGDGMIALYADGHQEWLEPDAAVHALQQLADRAAKPQNRPATAPSTNMSG